MKLISIFVITLIIKCFDSCNQLLKYHVKFSKIRLKTN